LYNKIIANDRKIYKKRSINFIIATSTKSLDLVTNLLLLRSGTREIEPKKAAGNHLEVVSKPRIRLKGKAQADRESAVRHTFWRMSIYRRPAIPPLAGPLGLRWGFETTSTLTLCK